MIRVEIDSNSGFCGGVIRAISTAEKFLSANSELYSLGAIVHNEEELSRLQSLGLVTIDSIEEVPAPEAGKPLLIRAHGEPPQVYERIREKGFKLMDCTCPVVLNLQKAIREAYSRMSEVGGSIVIFGKIGHPEVLGLVGQVGGDVNVVQNLTQLRDLIESGKLHTDRDIELFSQTTMSPVEYDSVTEYLRGRMSSASLFVHKTICQQVAGRHRELVDFARSHDVIVFVSSKSSSNGKVLYDLCRSENARTYMVGSADELQREWFENAGSAGVCGATSTPKWLLEAVAEAIENLQ